MPKPQQPEIARSGYSEVTAEDAAKGRAGRPLPEKGIPGPIPEDNLPGHHPEHEQDKPEGPPPRPRARKATKATKAAPAVDLRDGQGQPGITRFRFDFEPRVAPLSFAFGVTPWTSAVEVVDGELHIRFGPWSLRTPLDNVEGAEITGPYSFAKVAGPAHLSLADRGVTFATSTKRGVCIRFREPVPALMPGRVLRHPAVTVTVEQPEHLVALLNA